MVYRYGALLNRADNNRKLDVAEMIPLSDLGRPGIPRNSKRGDDEDFGYRQFIEQQVTESRQCDDRLAQAHVQKQRRNPMRFDIFDAKLLVVVRCVFHSASSSS